MSEKWLSFSSNLKKLLFFHEMTSMIISIHTMPRSWIVSGPGVSWLDMNHRSLIDSNPWLANMGKQWRSKSEEKKVGMHENVILQKPNFNLQAYCVKMQTRGCSVIAIYFVVSVKNLKKTFKAGHTNRISMNNCKRQLFFDPAWRMQCIVYEKHLKTLRKSPKINTLFAIKLHKFDLKGRRALIYENLQI